jgi:hypothetical protein
MTATVNRPTGRENARPIPVDLVRPPRFYWPSQKDQTPTHCGHCGARLLVGDAPTADYPLTDAACWACTRVACELAHDSTRRTPTPDEYAALPRTAGRQGVVHHKGTAAERVVRRLSEQDADDVGGLAHAFGIPIASVRQAVQTARKRGHRIVMSGGLYSLERES